MQELVDKTFFYFPKKQHLCLLYSDEKVLKSSLFTSLILQISPRNTFFFKVRKTKLGSLLAVCLNQKITIKLPKEATIFIGYQNKEKLIFFEFNKENKPISVYKKENDIWLKSDFLGFSLIENYSVEEYFLKREIIKEALTIQWKKNQDKKQLHGDFTHFNILVDAKKKISFIDEKEVKNSVLYDHFYFYAYYIQCLERSREVTQDDVEKIKKDVLNIIKSICKTDNLSSALKSINLNDATGLFAAYKTKLLTEFIHFMKQ